MKKTSLFKRYLQAKEILMIPVAHDPLCATIIERAGFKVLGCGGLAAAQRKEVEADEPANPRDRPRDCRAAGGSD